ncbi:MAG: ABC transporter ATP-binding protein [Clostridia bacterium]|nr:ABC transporter ATP-binding protein [Clostridia bacterium]
MLQIKNLCKSYKKGIKTIDSLNLQVNAGEIYGFIGHNGAGKSTTIRCMVGALDFEDGEILIDGLNVKNQALDCKRLMAYIPDNPDIYDHLTGFQYINFVCDIFRIDGKERNEKIERFALEFGLEKNLGDLISSYSHGMKQKLVIISALIHNPKLLVLDEPFVGLDPVATHKLKEQMKELCKNGSAIFFSTHVLDVAEKLCDRVGIIKNGSLVAEGEVKELLKDKSLESFFLEIQNA